MSPILIGAIVDELFRYAYVLSQLGLEPLMTAGAVVGAIAVGGLLARRGRSKGRRASGSARDRMIDSREWARHIVCSPTLTKEG
jgi:hypothetical protein